MESWVIINFFIAISIGAIIGLEREIVHQKASVKDFGGVRNFVLIALFGFIFTYFSIFIINSKTLLIIGFAGFFALISAAYLVLGLRTKRYSTTSEIAAIITFVLSGLVASSSDTSFRIISIIATIIVASLLAFKSKLHDFAQKVEMGEVFATIKMAIISIVVLPLLPNKNYTILDVSFINNLFTEGSKSYLFFQQLNVFNPFNIWLMVLLITGISFIGYFLVKIVGERKGLGITGFLGGVASSTAVTVSMSKKSKNQKNINGFALAIVLASSIMFLRILFEVLVVNKNLLPSLALPLGIMAFVGFCFSAWLFFRKSKKGIKDKVELKNPFEFNTALKFGLFFLLILILSKAGYILLGDTGIYIISIFSGLADVDAITLTLSSLVLSGVLSSKVAIISITLAAAMNTIVKAGIVRFMGDKKLARLISVLFFIILIVGLGIAIFV
jgi:uncharacterized membrane protein (DUF4010 family)